MAKASPVRSGHYSGIGRIIVSWARLEAHIIRVLEAMLRINQADALVVFWHMAHKERMDRLATLFYMDHEDKDDPVRIQFEKLVKRLTVAQNVRNTAGHGLWFKGKVPNSIKLFQMRARGSDVRFTGRGLEPVEFTPKSLMDEAKTIDQLAADFRSFFKVHYRAKFIYKRK